MKKQLSICIVSYNVSKYLDGCIQSIKKNVTDLIYEIVIVDNNSSDDSVEMLRKKFSEVILLENNNNIGYAPAMNMAIKKATGDYVLILSPDTVIKGNAIQTMYNYMLNNSEVGIVGPKTYNGEGEIVTTCHSDNIWISMVGHFFNLSTVVKKNKLLKKIIVNVFRIHTGVTNNYEETRDVLVLDGGCYMFSRELIDQVGLLDDAIAIGPDDYDICKRAKIKGFGIVYLSEAEITHFIGTSKNKIKQFTITVHYPSILYYYIKWHKSLSSLFFFFFFVSNLLSRSFFHFLIGEKSYGNAYKYAIKKSFDVYTHFDQFLNKKKLILNENRW